MFDKVKKKKKSYKTYEKSVSLDGWNGPIDGRVDERIGEWTDEIRIQTDKFTGS